jgi:hypothetical protein
MRAPRSLLACLLLIAAAAGVVRADTPAPEQTPHSGAPDDGDEAQTRNEARSRPTRAEADKNDDDKNAADKQAASKSSEKAEPGGKDQADDQGRDEKNEESGKLALTSSQQAAVGIQVAMPLPLTSAPEVEAYATVLDPVTLLNDADRIESTRAAAAAASADAARQESLYHDGAQVSLKAVQTSRAQAVEANAQAQAATLSFAQQWGPLADLSAARRRTLIEALASGRRLLLRADVPGRHLGGALGTDALVEVDGVHIAARVLGPLPRTDVQSQSAGWLLEVARPPPGFGPGARAAARLKAGVAHGLLVPAAALIYAQGGTYVYRRIPGDKRDTFAYESVAVKPLTPVGQAWLVDGVAHEDEIVVQGAGVLWSLQGIASFSAAEEEHD